LVGKAQHGKNIAESIPGGPGTGGKLGFQGSEAKSQGGVIDAVDVRGINNQHGFEERAKLGRFQAASVGRILNEGSTLKYRGQGLGNLVGRRHPGLL
jgi:hypothetical protein